MPVNNIIHLLKVDSVKVDAKLNQRAKPHPPEYIEYLASVLRDGGEFKDAPIVYEDREGVLWLAGGFGRQAAAQLAEVKEMKYEVRIGEYRDAFDYSLGDNAEHGRRREKGDVQKAIEVALADEEYAAMSDRALAKIIKCDSSYVSQIRKQITGKSPDPAKQRFTAKSADNPQPDEQDEDSGEVENRNRETSDEPDVPFEVGVETQTGNGSASPPLTLPRDRLGRILPDHLIPVFNDGVKVREAARKAKEAQSKAESANKSNTIGGFLRRFPDVIPGLDAAYRSLERCVPFCVCPACDGNGGDITDKGNNRHNCPTCTGQGWINYAQFETLHKSMRDHAKSFAPGDSWEGDDEPTPPSGPSPAFQPAGPGIDAMGRKIPPKLRDVFADEYLPEVAANLRRTAASLKSVSAWNPHLKPMWLDLEKISEHIGGVRPYAVCDQCKGKGCEACLTSGFLPKWMEHELQSK